MSILSSMATGFVGMFTNAISTAIGTAMGIIGVEGLQSLGSALDGIASKFIEANAAQERYLATLGVLMGSADKASGIWAQMQQLAMETPFSTDSLMKAVNTLKMFGFQNEELIPIIKRVGDAAAASPLGMETAIWRISLALGQIRSSVKLTMQDVNQLAQSGVPVFEILSKKMGKSVAEIRAMNKSGLISGPQAASMIMEGMDERFGGMMKKMSETWEGRLENIKDKLTFTLRDIGKPFFEIAKANLNRAFEWMKSDEATRFAAQAREIVANLSKLADAKIAAGLEWLQGDEAAAFAKWMGSIAMRAYEIASSGVSKAFEFLRSDAARNFANDVAQLTGRMVELVQLRVGQAFDWITDNWQAIKGWTATLWEAAKALAPLVAGIHAVRFAMTAVAIPIGAVGAALLGLSTNPVGALIISLGLLASAFGAAKLAGKDFGEYIATIAGRVLGLKNAVTDLQDKEGREKSDNKIVGRAEDAIAAGDVSKADLELRNADAAIAAKEERLRKMRAQHDKETAKDRAAIEGQSGFRRGIDDVLDAAGVETEYKRALQRARKRDEEENELRLEIDALKINRKRLAKDTEGVRAGEMVKGGVNSAIKDGKQTATEVFNSAVAYAKEVKDKLVSGLKSGLKKAGTEEERLANEWKDGELERQRRASGQNIYTGLDEGGQRGPDAKDAKNKAMDRIDFKSIPEYIRSIQTQVHGPSQAEKRAERQRTELKETMDKVDGRFDKPIPVKFEDPPPAVLV